MRDSITTGAKTLSSRVGSTTRRAANAALSLEQRIAQNINAAHQADIDRTGWRSTHLGALIDLQSLDVNSPGATDVNLAETSIVDGIQDAIVTAGTEAGADGQALVDDLTTAQVDAALISASAFGTQENALENFRLAAENVTRPSQSSTEWSRTNVQDFGTGFGYSENSVYASEAYDARNLTAFVGDTVTFNLQAARQRPFGEALYPTITLTPDQTGLDLTIRRTMILNAKRHAYTGKFEDFNRRNIIDALADHTVLGDQSNKIIPCYDDASQESMDHFGAGLAPKEVEIAPGVKVKTAPLRPGVTIGLTGIGQNPIVNAGGQLNQTDAIDQAVWLNSLVIRLGDSGNTLADNFEFNVRGLADTMFLKSPNMGAKNIQLNFVTEDLHLSAVTKAYGDVAAPALAFMATAPFDKYVVKLAINVSANLDIETGKLNLISGKAGIADVLEPDGESGMKKVEDAGRLATVRTNLGGLGDLVGYTLDASYSNVNRRNAGIFINVYEERTLYVVPLGSPITLQTPATNTRTNADMAAPIAAARARNENNAVTQLFKFYDQLKNIKALLSYGSERCKSPRIEGMGHTVVYPYVEDVTCDLTKQAQGLKSSERMLDVAATLTNTIRDLSYNMWIKSFYQAAAENYGGQVVKPTLIIATDPEIERHLMDLGDTRLAGIYFDYQVVSTLDLRMRGKIVLAFQRPSTGRADPLAFGCMAFIPELVTTITQPREGSTSRETMVQQRTLHVNTCPIMGMITVKGIRPAVTGRLDVPMNMVGA